MIYLYKPRTFFHSVISACSFDIWNDRLYKNHYSKCGKKALYYKIINKIQMKRFYLLAGSFQICVNINDLKHLNEHRPHKKVSNLYEILLRNKAVFEDVRNISNEIFI